MKSTSVRRFAGAKYTFAVASCSANREDIIKYIVHPLLNLLGSNGKNVLKVSGFVESISDCKMVTECLHEYLNPFPPATITVQAPLMENDIQLLFWLVDVGSEIQINSVGPGVVVVHQRDIDFVHIGGIKFEPLQFEDSQIKEKWFYSYWQHLDSLLAQAGFNGDDIIRLWLHINDITEYENGVENYQLANRVRSLYFDNHEFFKGQKIKRKGFPASTGIGTKDNTIAMHCIALRPRNKEVFVTPLENPLQSRTVDYDEKHGPFRPKFSRGAAVVCQNKAMVFVSGTASIVHSDTAFIDDPEKQCEQTLENIDKLLSTNNFESSGITVFEDGLKTLAYAKIYLKNREHFNIIKKTCETRLPDIPMIFVEADICRPELLVEIEGTAFTEAKVVTNVPQ